MDAVHGVAHGASAMNSVHGVAHGGTMHGAMHEGEGEGKGEMDEAAPLFDYLYRTVVSQVGALQKITAVESGVDAEGGIEVEAETETDVDVEVDMDMEVEVEVDVVGADANTHDPVIAAEVARYAGEHQERKRRVKLAYIQVEEGLDLIVALVLTLCLLLLPVSSSLFLLPLLSSSSLYPPPPLPQGTPRRSASRCAAQHSEPPYKRPTFTHRPRRSS